MKQILQSLKDGTTQLADVPAPGTRPGHLLIRSRASLISAGTERMLIEFGKANWFDKARQQPDKVRMVLDKIRSDGIGATFDAIRGKLDQPLAPGYCSVGVVVDVGAGVEGFAAGDRVVSNGKHAEFVSVPRNLCARIPDNVADEDAAFTVLGAIGLQAIRLANPLLGECVVVMGLGLVGLLTAQMLRAQGCRVLGIDLDPERLALAARFAIDTADPGRGDDVLARALDFSRGRGVDAVIVAVATQSNEPVSQAAKMCRKRGRIVLVGVSGLELSRTDFYEKELSFQVSCSYGPGRYDPNYEQAGNDYPVGFVRWTEQRNFEAVLDLIAAAALQLQPLVSHRFAIDEAARAYDVLTSNEPSLGILIGYPSGADPVHAIDPPARVVHLRMAGGASSNGVVGCIGAGGFGGQTLIGAFAKAGATLHTLASASGVSAAHFGRKFSFARATTDVAALIADPQIDTVVVCTRHDTHAHFVLQALVAGKHVFVEKPLCLTLEESSRIEASLGDRLLMVGFNRRFAPHTVRMRQLLAGVREPKAFVMTVNAGAIAADHWTQDPQVGGGRIVGECCHFIDLLRHLAGAPITGFDASALGDRHGPALSDKATITLRFADGSIGTVHYLANGHKGFPKERLEVFSAGRILRLDNFRRLRGWGWPRFAGMNLWRQDKGHAACAAAFIDAVRAGKPCPIAADEIFEVSRVSIQAQMALA